MMKRQSAVIVLALMILSCMSVQFRPGSRPIHPGAGNFIFTDTRGSPDRPVTVWYYQPDGFSRDMPVLFVMHGVKRDARRYRDEWIQYAERYGFLLIAPEFSHKYYPGKREYNDGNLFDRMGNIIPESDQAFTVIEHLFDFVKEATRNQSSSYDIYGHSAGGQFVQRMILFKTDARIRMAVAANPGVYVLPIFSEKYPYGIRNSGMTPDHLRVAFERDFMLLLGEKDVKEDDANLSSTPEALEQGHNSFERGNNFHDSAKNEASRLGMTFNWKLTTIPGAAHSDAQLALTAAQTLFYKGND
jgi:dienelactone hydrolase